MSLRLFPLILVLVGLLVEGCQSPQTGTTMILPDRDDASTADGGAYTADSMNFRKPMPSHPDWRPMDFYYKHCSELGDRSYYSKTAYACSEP